MTKIIRLVISLTLMLASVKLYCNDNTLDFLLQAYEQFAHQAIKLSAKEFDLEKAKFEKMMSGQTVTLQWNFKTTQRVWFDKNTNTSGCVIILNGAQYRAACAILGIEKYKIIPEGIFRDLQGNKKYRLFDTFYLTLTEKGSRFYNEIKAGDKIRLSGKVTAFSEETNVDNSIHIAIDIIEFATTQR